MNIHHDLEKIKMMALHHAKEHKCNYNIILFNPGKSGEFDLDAGSTYEYVADSYFEKERPNVKLLFKTDDLLQKDKVEETLPTDGIPTYVINNPHADFKPPIIFRNHEVQGPIGAILKKGKRRR